MLRVSSSDVRKHILGWLHRGNAIGGLRDLK
jgi:hypothetical protein